MACPVFPSFQVAPPTLCDKIFTLLICDNIDLFTLQILYRTANCNANYLAVQVAVQLNFSQSNYLSQFFLPGKLGGGYFDILHSHSLQCDKLYVGQLRIGYPCGVAPEEHLRMIFLCGVPPEGQLEMGEGGVSPHFYTRKVPLRKPSVFVSLHV